MKFATTIEEPYLITYEEREYHKLSVVRLGANEYEVEGTEGSVALWVMRTSAVPLTDEELQQRLAKQNEPPATEEPVVEPQQAEIPPPPMDIVQLTPPDVDPPWHNKECC